MDVKPKHEFKADTKNKLDWFLAATKPKQEFRAIENLANQKIHAYCPIIKIEKISAQKKQIFEEALFKGYIFININQDDPLWHKVRSTRGIRDWIRFSGEVAKVPSNLISGLKKADKYLLPNSVQLGDKVRILSGPFEGLEGIYQKNDGEVRAIILLNFLGQSTRLKIDKAQIVKE